MPTLTLTLSVDLPSDLFEPLNDHSINNLPINTNAKIIQFDLDQPITPNLSNCQLQLNLPNLQNTTKHHPKPLPVIPAEEPTNGLQLISSSNSNSNSNSNSPNQKYITLNSRNYMGSRTSLPPKNRSSKITKVSLNDILDDDELSYTTMSRASSSSSTLNRVAPSGPRPLLADSPPLTYPSEIDRSTSVITHRRSSSLAATLPKQYGSVSKKSFISTCHKLLKKSSFSALPVDQSNSQSDLSPVNLSRLQSRSECPSIASSVEDLTAIEKLPRRKSIDLCEASKHHQPLIRPRNQSLKAQRPLTVYWGEASSDRFPGPSPFSSPQHHRSVSLAKTRGSKATSLFTRNKSHKSMSTMFQPMEERQSAGLDFLWDEVHFDRQIGQVKWNKLEHLPWFNLDGGKLSSDQEDEGLVIADAKLSKSPSKNTDMRYFVSLELLTTESSYLSSLRNITKHYYTPLVEASPSPISPDDLNTIFFTLNQLLKLSETLEFIIVTVVDETSWSGHTSCIGPIFLDFKEDWNIFLKYCNNYTSTLNLIKQLYANNAQFKQLIDEGNQQNPSKQNFIEMLILPIQRLTRYSLLLNALKKHTNPSHPDYLYLVDALHLMDGLGIEANRAYQPNAGSVNSKATQELHLSVKNCPPNLIVPSNSKLLTIEAHDLISQRRVKMYIFDNILIMTVSRKKWQLMKTGDRWKYLATLQVNHLHLAKVMDGTGKLLDPPVAILMGQPSSPSIGSLASEADSGIRGSQSSSIDSNATLDSSIDCQYFALQFHTGKNFREWLAFVSHKLMDTAI